MIIANISDKNLYYNILGTKDMIIINNQVMKKLSFKIRENFICK